MKRNRHLEDRWSVVLALCLPFAAANAQTAATPTVGPPGTASVAATKSSDTSEAIAKLRQDYNAALARQRDAIEAVKTDEERGAAARKFEPDTKSFFVQAMALAEKATKTPDAFDALFFAISVARDDGDLASVVDRLIRDHLDDERIGDLAGRYAYGAQGPTERLLVAMSEHSTLRSVRGKALLALASSHKWTAGDDASKLALAHAEYERVVKEFADIKTSRGATLGETASRAIFALDNLVPGKPCPSIEGKDVDGVAFSLADYKGKVVMIDFWGFW